jgi:hypothetical protein
LILAALGEMQPTTIRNLRMRLEFLDFCEAAEPLGAHRDSCYPLSDGRFEYTLGDLLAGEERHACFNLAIAPLPVLTSDHTLTLEGEGMIAVEIEFDLQTPEGLRPRKIMERIVARRNLAVTPVPVAVPVKVDK